jgi:hypothetical protein
MGVPGYIAIIERPAMRTSIATTLALGVLLTLSACVSTTLTERWKDASYSAAPLHKVLVVGVQRDQGRRRIWEDAMVAALAHRAVQAEASYQVFPDQAPSPDQLSTIATRDGFDGVVATHFVSSSQRAYIEPYAGWGCRWRCGGWGWGWPGYSGEYVESETLTDYQTDVFTVDAGGGKLIWSGVTRSLDPSSTTRVTEEISRVLLPNLIKDGILTGKTK